MCKPTKGACPECGGGTVKKQEAGSLDADHRYKAAVARKAERERSEKLRQEFEEFYAERERERLQAVFAEIARLPEVEYRDLPRGARPEAA
jgi:hypothetical protein